MKTKTRTLNLTLAAGSKRVDQYAYPSGTFIETATANTAASSYVSLLETITYDEPKRKSSGFCKHEKTSLTYFGADFGTSFVESRRYTYAWSGGYIARDTIWSRSQYVTDPVTIDSIDWSKLSFQAMQRMRPDLSGGLMLGAFVAELPKPRTMLTKWRQFLSELTNQGLRSYLIKRWNKFSKTWSSIPKAAADANLWYQFGLKPFVQDLQLTYQNLTTLERRIEEMLREAGKPSTKHFARHVDITRQVFGVEAEVWHDADYKNQLVRKYQWCTQPIYHATVTYILDADELRGVLGTVRGLISTLGLDKIFSTIWELVPFSFVVDWFIGVNEFLDSLDNQLFGALPILVLDFNHSIKYEYMTSVTWKCWVTQSIPGSAPKVFAQTEVAQRRVAYYERRKSIPTLVDLTSAQGLTVNRVGLAASLVVSNRSWRRD